MRFNTLLLSLILFSTLQAQPVQFELSQSYVDSEWLDRDRKDYSYDLNNNLQLTDYLAWNRVMWYRRLQEFHYRAPNGQIDSTIHIDSTQKVFERNLYYHSSLGRLDSIIKQNAYGNNPLSNTERTVYFYDTFGNQVEIQRSFFRSGAWLLQHRVVQTYDGGGRIERQRFYTMDVTGWYLDQEVLNQYDAAGRKEKTALLSFIGDTILSIDYFFGANGKTSYHNTYLHYNTGPVLSGRNEYSWNANDDLDTLTNLVLDPSDTSLVPQMRWIYGYSPFVSITEDAQQMDIRFYPNPVQDWLKYELVNAKEGELSLWTMDGKKLESYPLTQEQGQISLAHLPKGIYLLKYQEGSLRMEQRILKY